MATNLPPHGAFRGFGAPQSLFALERHIDKIAPLRSDDWGASWSSAADGLPKEPATAFLVAQGSLGTLYAVVQGRIWASVDGGRSWARRGAEVSPTNFDTFALDPEQPTRLWAAGGDRLFRSNDGGVTWTERNVGLPGRLVTALVIVPQVLAMGGDGCGGG